MKTKIALVLLIISGALVYADEGFVDFIDGNADIKNGNSWDYLDIGDSVSNSDVIRLEDNSYLEIKFKSITLKLTQKGQYKIDDLLKSNQKVSNASFGNKTKYILNKILYGDDSLAQSTAGGVRGDPIEDLLDSIPDSDSAYLREASKAFEAGETDAALAKFLEAWDFAEDIEQEMMSAYFISLIYYQKGEMSKALSYLDEVWLNEFSQFYGLIVYLKATILIETNGNQQALDWIAKSKLKKDDPVL